VNGYGAQPPSQKWDTWPSLRTDRTLQSYSEWLWSTAARCDATALFSSFFNYSLLNDNVRVSKLVHWQHSSGATFPLVSTPVILLSFLSLCKQNMEKHLNCGHGH
jgi:hypothetical protein